MKIIRLSSTCRFKDLSKKHREAIALIKLVPNKTYVPDKGKRDGEFFILVEEPSDRLYLEYISEGGTDFRNTLCGTKMFLEVHETVISGMGRCKDNWPEKNIP